MGGGGNVVSVADAADDPGEEEEYPAADWPGVLELAQSNHGHADFDVAELFEDDVAGADVDGVHAHCGEEGGDDVNWTLLDLG